VKDARSAASRHTANIRTDPLKLMVFLYHKPEDIRDFPVIAK
jgi:hypothetical protein